METNFTDLPETKKRVLIAEDDFKVSLFMPFERVEQSRDRKTGGTGLGLAICSSIVNSLGGGIEARNLNPGFEVCISIPAQS